MPININVNMKIIDMISTIKRIIKIPPKLNITNYITNWEKGVNITYSFRKINTPL